jgi:hypothetical protein
MFLRVFDSNRKHGRTLKVNPAIWPTRNPAVVSMTPANWPG